MNEIDKLIRTFTLTVPIRESYAKTLEESGHLESFMENIVLKTAVYVERLLDDWEPEADVFAEMNKRLRRQCKTCGQKPR